MTEPALVTMLTTATAARGFGYPGWWPGKEWALHCGSDVG